MSHIVNTSPKNAKPKYRGYSHQISAMVAFCASLLLVFSAPETQRAWAAAIFGLSITALFGISAFYHRPYWTPKRRQFLRRLDHAAIFLLIAGTYTSIILLTFPEDAYGFMLSLVWGGAGLGILQTIFWPTAPKALFAFLCVVLGWVAVLSWEHFRNGLTDKQLIVIGLGGCLYTIGAVVYALRRPDPWPKTFGYHEVFHALTIAAAICHAYVIYQLVMH